jgi:hypothetical protein
MAINNADAGRRISCDDGKPLRSRWLLLLAALLLLGFFAVTPAQAADARGGDQVVIGRDEVINDDLYVAGNTVTIDGTVKGDVVAVFLLRQQDQASPTRANVAALLNRVCPGRSIAATWLMRRAVRRPVASASVACRSSALCRLSISSAATSPARAIATASPFRCWMLLPTYPCSGVRRWYLPGDLGVASQHPLLQLDSPEDY